MRWTTWLSVLGLTAFPDVFLQIGKPFMELMANNILEKESIFLGIKDMCSKMMTRCHLFSSFRLATEKVEREACVEIARQVVTF